MATIKSYTDLEQSKVLAKILPLKNADMFFSGCAYPKELHLPTFNKTSIKDNIPCWSLATLISILPNEIKHDGIVYNLWITSEDVSYYSKEYDSYLYCEEGCTIDACYEMILKLHEQKLL